MVFKTFNGIEYSFAVLAHLFIGVNLQIYMLEAFRSMNNLLQRYSILRVASLPYTKKYRSDIR